MGRTASRFVCGRAEAFGGGVGAASHGRWRVDRQVSHRLGWQRSSRGVGRLIRPDWLGNDLSVVNVADGRGGADGAAGCSPTVHGETAGKAAGGPALRTYGERVPRQRRL